MFFMQMRTNVCLAYTLVIKLQRAATPWARINVNVTKDTLVMDINVLKKVSNALFLSHVMHL